MTINPHKITRLKKKKIMSEEQEKYHITMCESANKMPKYENPPLPPKKVTPMLEETALDNLKAGDVFMHFEKNDDFGVKFDVVEMVDYCNPNDVFLAGTKRNNEEGAYRKSYPLREMDNSAKYFKEIKSAKNTQVGGNHYSKMKIQPIEYIMANKLSFPVGNVVKYVSRYDKKNNSIELQIQDLEKAKQNIDFMIEELKNKER